MKITVGKVNARRNATVERVRQHLADARRCRTEGLPQYAAFYLTLASTGRQTVGAYNRLMTSVAADARLCGCSAACTCVAPF